MSKTKVADLEAQVQDARGERDAYRKSYEDAVTQVKALTEERDLLAADFAAVAVTLIDRDKALAAKDEHIRLITEDARMQGDALAHIFSVLTDVQVPTDPDALKAADIAASAIAALESYCPHEAENELLREALRRIVNSSEWDWHIDVAYEALGEEAEG